MRVRNHKTNVGRDGTDVGDMIVHALQFQKNGSYLLGAGGDLYLGGLFDSLAESRGVRETRVTGNTLGQIGRVRYRQLLEALLDSFVHIEHAQLQVQNRFARDGEAEVSRFD